MGDTTIRLALPAEAEYSRVARTAVAGLGLRLGFPYQVIEDLLLAVDEALILLLRPDVAGGKVTFVFEPTDDALVVDAVAQPVDGTDVASVADEDAAAARRRFERLIDPIVDSWSLSDHDRHVHLVKHRS